MDPLGKISLKNNKKTFPWHYCTMVYMFMPIINRRDPSQWELQNICMKWYFYVNFIKFVIEKYNS